MHHGITQSGDIDPKVSAKGSKDFHRMLFTDDKDTFQVFINDRHLEAVASGILQSIPREAVDRIAERAKIRSERMRREG